MYRRFAAEDKTRIVLEGLKGGTGIGELCRREGIDQKTFYRWSQRFIEAGTKRFHGRIERNSAMKKATDLENELVLLKERLYEVSLENRILKKSLTGLDSNMH